MTKRMRSRKLYSEGRSAGPHIDPTSNEGMWSYYLRQAEAALARHDVHAWVLFRGQAARHLAATVRGRRQ